MEVWVESLDAASAAWEATVRKAVHRTLDSLRQPSTTEVSVLLADDPTIQRLNREYRHIDTPTDVLSFAQGEGEPLAGGEDFLGDIVISVPRASQQAQQYGHSMAREMAFLAIHGTLHLLGWDHQTAETEAAMMATTEAILEPLGLTR